MRAIGIPEGKMAPQVGLEPTTVRLTVGNLFVLAMYAVASFLRKWLHPNKLVHLQGKRFPSFWLVLYGVRAQFPHRR